MAECCYDWRKYFEDKDDGGSRVNWVAKLPDGHLILSSEAMPGMYWMCFPDGKTKHGLSKHSLVPKRTLRPWTPEEAAKHLGAKIYNGSDEQEFIDAVTKNGVIVFSGQYGPSAGKRLVTFESLIDQKYTLAAGGFCGVFDEVK